MAQSKPKHQEIDAALTRKLAHLARLELTDTEVQSFTEKLAQVVSYIELLQEVDVDGVEPLTQSFDAPTAANYPFREDVIVAPPRTADGKPKVLTCAPDALYDGFKVPQIV